MYNQNKMKTSKSRIATEQDKKTYKLIHRRKYDSRDKEKYKEYTKDTKKHKQL